MRPARIIFPVLRVVIALGLAAVLILGLCVAFAGQAVSSSNYSLSTADNLTLSLSASGQIASLQIDGNELVSAPTPALWLRDLSDAGTVITPNLIANPGFEEELTTGWTEATNNGLDVSIVVSPTHSATGTLQLANLFTNTRVAAYASDPVTVTAGQRYRVSAWWRSATGYVAKVFGLPTWQMTLFRTPEKANGLYVQWLDADSQLLDNPQLAVALHQNAHHWRLLRRELTAPGGAAFARVIIGARLLGGETLWVDDVALVPSPEEETAVQGTVTSCSSSGRTEREAGERRGGQGDKVTGGQEDADCLMHTATLSQEGLVFTVTYTAHTDHLAIHGEITDTTGQDRALDVTWGVPVGALDAWTWWDDAHTSRPITDTSTYAHVLSAIYDGWLPISLYPYAGISGGEDGNLGLALGLPLDRPQLALLAYDGATSRYGAAYHLGISPQAIKVGPRATFDLMLYRFDPAWGFRDVIARHHVLQPEAYAMDVPLYDRYTGYEQGNYCTLYWAENALEEDEEDVYSAQYTGTDMPLEIASESEPRPTLDQAPAVVSSTLSSTVTWEADLARAITHSAIVDPNGDWSLKRISVPNWNPEWWETAWPANMDPELDEGMASWTMDWRVIPAFTATTQIGAHLDGVMIDNFMAAPAFDLRPEALEVADWPLAYTPHTYQPAVHNGFPLREYLTFLRDYLDANWGTDRGLSVNFWGLGHSNYLVEYIDGFVGEGWVNGSGEGGNWNPEILDYRRAIAYGRPYMYADHTEELTASEAYTFTRLALLYGVEAGCTECEGEAERIITGTAQLVTRYWAAGWEPLTYARADGEGVWIERFGESSTGEGLYFTVHNRTDVTRTADITIETAPLGLADPVSATITDLATDHPVPFGVVDGNIVVTLALGLRDTRVLQVSPPASQCVRDANQNGLGDVVDIMTTASELPCHVYLPLVAAQWRQPWPTLSTTVSIDANPAHGPGSLSPLWRPSIVWQGGGVSFTNINPTLVDYWAGLGGFDRIGLVRIMPELDSLARGVYSLAEFEPLVERVRDHGGRLLVKIIDTPEEYTNTPNPPSACPPDDPLDWRYPYRYSKYGVASDKEAGFKALIQDYIRYFSQQGGTVTNRALFGDDDPHPTLGMPDVLYEVWNEPNYEYQWCDTEENFWHLYQLIVEAADELRALAALTPTPRPEGHPPPPLPTSGEGEGGWGEGGEGLLPFTIGGPGWRHETLRNDGLPPAFGAPDCLAADNPNCGAIRRFYDFLQEQGYLENGHLSWWSYSYRPDEVSTGNTDWHLDRIRAILNDARYEGHYASTLVVLGEWAPPFANRFVDLLPDDEWADEYNVLFGKNINDDNEVGASLVPARIWDMTQARPRPDLQAYFTVAEWPQNDYLPLFKGTVGVFTSQTTGLIKAITNVFGLLNQLGEQELAADYLPNSRLNLLATANENGDRIAVLGWHHVNIKPYETGDVVQYNDLLAGLEADGIGPVTATLSFQNLTPGATYTQTVYVVDQTRSNAFSYRQAAADDLTANCGANPETWQRSCIYERVAEINDWTLDNTGGAASVALESTAGTLTADDQGRAEVTITLEPYSVWLVELEQQ